MVLSKSRITTTNTATEDYVYDEGLHTNQSADALAGLITEFFHPSSVADFGCGKGQFLASFKKLGITEVRGFDGPWAYGPSRANLTPNEFVEVNFENSHEIIVPSVDLTISFEVAEHISAQASADFIKLLCDSSNLVVFSAALPKQGGQGHINEQPLSEWSREFSNNNMSAHDIIRPLIWDNDDIEIWYRQNMCVFTKIGSTAEKIAEEIERNQTNSLLDLVHPGFYQTRVEEYEQRLARIYQGGIKPLSYLYLFGKSLTRAFKRDASE